MSENFKHLRLKTLLKTVDGLLVSLQFCLVIILEFGHQILKGKFGDEREAAKWMSQDLTNHQKER